MADIDFDKLRITNKLIISEALGRGWGVEVLDYRLGLIAYAIPGKVEKIILRSTTGHHTSALSTLIADDKLVSADYAQKAGFNVLATTMFSTPVEADKFLQKHNKIVVKPLDSAHGKGVTTNVTDKNSLRDALNYAVKYSTNVLMQEFLKGEDIRLLFIGGVFCAGAIRRPAEVKGDGIHSVKQLIKLENNSGKRAPDYRLPINLIAEVAAANFLGDKLSYVPKAGEVIQVVGTANIGTGGYAEDITDELDSSLIKMAQKAAIAWQMDICAFDFLRDKDSGRVNFLEVNSTPSFGLHVYPAIGKPRPLAKTFLDWLDKHYTST